jgi:malate dehydrogenase
VPSDGSYDIPEGVLFGYPVTCKNGEYQIVRGLSISEFSRGRIANTYKELTEERSAIESLIK